MGEAQRLSWLNALGITQYVPIQPFEGVPQLPEAAIETEFEPESTSTGSSSEPLLREEPSAREEPVTGETPSEKTEKASAADALVSEPATLDLGRILDAESSPTRKVPPASHSKITAFSCRVLTLPDATRLLVQLSAPDAPDLSALEYRMLSDLLRAMSVPTLEQHANRIYRWPVINNPRLASDANAAREALAEFLSAVPGSRTVFLGDRAAAALGLSNEQRGSDPSDFLLLPSLTELQDSWPLKARSWSQLSEFLQESLS